jgi:adenine specific DNA methylase Mod/very-short-patch-repair endonuclease
MEKTMTKEEKFYKALEDVFIGATIEGTGGFINLMKIKSNYYKKIEEFLKKDIEEALKKYPSFRDELFDKLYSFFSRYFTESGSIYFNSTLFHNNIYEKVYTDDRDVILFWKTQMLYYVKTDRIFRSMPVEFDGLKFYFDATTIENKKANEKRSLIYELKEIKEDNTIIFSVLYSERGTKTKIDDILKAVKKKGISLTEENLERAFRIFEKQSEVDFFINKNAKAFLQEQFKLWSYQYFWDGAKEWTAERVNELQILKDIAFKIIDFISQFEDELVKIWNKPKFVKNSNYVITLDKIKDISLIEKILSHKNIGEQIKEWQELGIVEQDFTPEEVFENYDQKDWDIYNSNVLFKDELIKQGLITTGYHLPYNPKLVVAARQLRKNMTPAETKLWYEYLRNFKYPVLRQRPIHHFIVDFYCAKLKLVIEIDGEQHYTVEGKAYDEERTKILEGYGLRVIRFRNEEVMNDFESVCKKIESIPPVSSVDNYIPPFIPPFVRGDKGGIKKDFIHLPIDTKYFKDLELEILNQFDDLDKSLDGWLIKSENYQALNTILPKFKEKVQTINIDPPFNLDSSDQFLYRTNYKDANWATLLENRIRIAREWLNEKGSIFVRCDYNGNWIVRCLMDEIFGKENFTNEINVNRSKIAREGISLARFATATDTLFYYRVSENSKFFVAYKLRNREPQWNKMHSPSEYKSKIERIVNGQIFVPPKGRHWSFTQEKINKLIQENRIRIVDEEYTDIYGNKQYKMLEYLEAEMQPADSNWTDIPGYSSTTGFQTENSEILLKRVIESTSNEGNLVMDFFLGSGTTTAVAHKLGRKWIGVEMGEHFYTVVLPRMKKVLAYDKSGISKEVKEYQGGGFFKYYELEQYEEALANTVYENHDIFIISNKSPYEQYVFLKDEKMLKALEIDYENNKIKVDLNKLYPNIDIAETLSNLTGKWIKRITETEVEFEDGTKVNTKDLDYKHIKTLIWWE